MLALSLPKCSPKSYSFLQVLLPLPTTPTLQSILRTFLFVAGINAHLFGALHHTLQNMCDRDQYCCLLFDEMSFGENVHFSQKLDCIEAFEDCGKARTCNIASHALVLCWSTSKVEATRFLNEVLGTCRTAGLHVFANICDMGANSVKSLKLLGATRWKPFFKLQNQGTVTVYDPPHLLKCTKNVFLRYDVQLESECVHIQLPATAKWEHILSVY
jgi:hypothetical protein